MTSLLLAHLRLHGPNPGVAFAAMGTLLLVVLFRKSLQRRQLYLRNRNRVSLSSHFAEQLQLAGFDSVISRAAYCVLRDHKGVSSPVLPTDSLEQDLGFNDDELEQVFLQLTAMIGGEPRPSWYLYPMRSVEDLIRAVQESAPAAFLLAA